MQAPILAGDAESQVADVVGVQRREASAGRHPKGRSKAIAGKARLEEERPVVIGLQRVASANLVKDEEPAISGTYNQRTGWERAVRKPHAWRKVGLIYIRKMLGIAHRSRRDDFPRCVVEIALFVVRLVE